MYVVGLLGIHTHTSLRHTQVTKNVVCRISPQERRALITNLKRISHLQKENLQLKLKQVCACVRACVCVFVCVGMSHLQQESDVCA